MFIKRILMHSKDLPHKMEGILIPPKPVIVDRRHSIGDMRRIAADGTWLKNKHRPLKFGMPDFWVPEHALE